MHIYRDLQEECTSLKIKCKLKGHVYTAACSHSHTQAENITCYLAEEIQFVYQNHGTGLPIFFAIPFRLGRRTKHSNPVDGSKH